MKKVLVTGANKGIGYEIAKQMSEKGFHVLLGARNINRGKAAVDEINKFFRWKGNLYSARLEQ